MKFKVMATSVDYAEDLVEKYPQLRKYGHELVIDKEAFFKRHMNPIAKEFEKEIFNFVDDNYRDTEIINNDKPKHCEDITQTVIEKYCNDDIDRLVDAISVFMDDIYELVDTISEFINELSEYIPLKSYELDDYIPLKEFDEDEYFDVAADTNLVDYIGSRFPIISYILKTRPP